MEGGREIEELFKLRFACSGIRSGLVPEISPSPLSSELYPRKPFSTLKKVSGDFFSQAREIYNSRTTFGGD